jgi:hypothetical protein
MGLLYGTVFALFCALFSLPVGLLSDATGNLRLAMLTIQWVAVPIALLMLLIARRAARDEQGPLARAEG